MLFIFYDFCYISVIIIYRNYTKYPNCGCIALDASNGEGNGSTGRRQRKHKHDQDSTPCSLAMIGCWIPLSDPVVGSYRQVSWLLTALPMWESVLWWMLRRRRTAGLDYKIVTFPHDCRPRYTQVTLTSHLTLSSLTFLCSNSPLIKYSSISA